MLPVRRSGYARLRWVLCALIIAGGVVVAACAPAAPQPAAPAPQAPPAAAKQETAKPAPAAQPAKPAAQPAKPAAAQPAAAKPAGGNPQEVAIALIAPLSGPWGRQGYFKRLGAEMAIDEINQQGGIKALGGAKMVLKIADAGDSVEKAKAAAQRLVAQEKDLVGGIGSWLSSFTLAVTEVTEREKLPWLSLSYSDTITDRGFKYVFQTSVLAGTQARETFPMVLKLAESVTGKRPTRVGVIHDNTAAPMSFIKPMREGGFQQLGLQVVVDEVFTPPLSDATPLVQKLRTQRPDFVFINPTAIPDLKLLLEKINEFGLGRGRLPLVGNGALAGTPDLLSAVTAEQLEGYLVSMGNWPGKQQQGLIERFKKRYPNEPWMIQDTMSTYGHVWILKEALERAGVADREKVAEAIRTMDITSGPAAEGFSGGRVKFDEKGRRVGAVMPMVQWQKGVPVTVFPPEVAVAEPIWPKQ